jgi:putative transcriptional regulator
MPRTCKSEALAAVQEMIERLHEGGTIDKRTLREFDEVCLAPAMSRFSPMRSKRSVRQSMSRSQCLRAISTSRKTSSPIEREGKSDLAGRLYACCQSSSVEGYRRSLGRPSESNRPVWLGYERRKAGPYDGLSL